MSGCTCINNGNNAMAIMQWVLLPALATHSTRLVCVAHTTVCSVAMLPYLLSVRAAVVVARVPGRPGIGGRTNRAARVSSARTIGHTCKHTNTRARTHTHTRRHSLRPRRSLRRLSSLSLPFVLVTACCPCHCHSSILRCTHCRVQCCHAAMLALRGRMLDRRSCACTPHLAVCMELHLYSTHDRRVETAWLRPQVSHQAPRPHWRPSMRSAAVALASLPPPGQSTGGKKK